MLNRESSKLSLVKRIIAGIRKPALQGSPIWPDVPVVHTSSTVSTFRYLVGMLATLALCNFRYGLPHMCKNQKCKQRHTRYCTFHMDALSASPLYVG